MTDEEVDRIHFLYKITNKINCKIYIGQSVDTIRRWQAHKRDSEKENPTSIISKAIKKYGVENFKFEVIAACRGWDNANEVETLLISQYNSLAENDKGYNVALGGYNAPKTEEFKQMMRDWHASLSPEQKAERAQKHSDFMFQYIAENGHPCEGRIVSEEERELHRKARLENPLEYTPELRQKMSEAHIGKVIPEEQREKMSIGIKKNWEERHAEMIASGELKCNAPGCDVSGIVEYLIVDNIRYCTVHGQRLKRFGRLDLLTEEEKKERSSKLHIPEEERREKFGAANLGKIPVNKIIYSDEQIALILSDPRGPKKLAKDEGLSAKAITRIRKEFKLKDN